MDENNIAPTTPAKSSTDKLTLPLAIILAGLLIGGGIYLNGRMTGSNLSPTDVARQGDAKGSLSIKSTLRPVDQNDFVLGNPSARVVIVEYSDTECPFCKIFHSTMNAIMQDYGSTGNVAWVYRHFPIEALHEKSLKQAEALECAGELGGNSKFWQYTNRVYELTPSNDGLDPNLLQKIAKEVGLDEKSFNTCLESGEFLPKIQAYIQNAQELGALGTPYSVLIDTKTGEYYPLEGAYPYTQLKQIIDLILKS